MGAPIYIIRYVFSIDELSGAPFTYGHTTDNLHVKIDILCIRLRLVQGKLCPRRDKLAFSQRKSYEAVVEVLYPRA